MTKINKSITSNTFGEDVVQPTIKLNKGTMTVVGAMVNDRPIPERGFSVNVKTGHPVTPSDKR